ncbi:hypothetical protein OC861_003149 [Tilletia horrida]|nr:hypothetical protein OC861_003149 [Tilletia horrida]
MTTIEVSNISKSTTKQGLEEFFSYCGSINNISLSSAGSSQKATIKFEKASAATTASMLSGGTLDGSNLEISLAQSAEDTAKTAANQTADAAKDTANQAKGAAQDTADQAKGAAQDAAGSAKKTAQDLAGSARKTAEDVTGSDVVGDAQKTAKDLTGSAEKTAKDAASSAQQTAQDLKDNIIGQEDKPRTAIIAEFLAHGYVISDSITQRAIDYDAKHGYSEKFKSFVFGLDRSLGEKIAKAPASAPTDASKETAEKAAVTDAGSDPSLTRQVQAQAHAVYEHPVVKPRADWAWTRLSDYYNAIVNHPRIKSLYEQTSRTVQDVHEEAKRIKEEKQQAK